MVRDKYIQEIVDHMEKHNKGLIHEYYITANSRNDAHLLKGIKIHIYNLDREQMTPHLHIVDDNGKIELEVSLLDWSIINVKTPKNVSNDWSNFRDIKNRFDVWLTKKHNKTNILNSFWLFELWDGENPNNILSQYSEEPNLNDDLKVYLELDDPKIDQIRLQRNLFGVLTPLFYNKETKDKLMHLKPIRLLKEIGLFEEYPVDENDEESIETINNVLRNLKIWTSNV